MSELTLNEIIFSKESGVSSKIRKRLVVFVPKITFFIRIRRNLGLYSVTWRSGGWEARHSAVKVTGVISS